MDPTLDAHSLYRSLLDEILYRDPPREIRQMEVRDGTARVVEIVTFVDGSRIVISAQVDLPPLEGMTPERVSFLNIDGQRGERWDDGSSEALRLARQSFAIRLIEKFALILDGMPECEKGTCSDCSGGKYCVHCYGKGCPECSGSGQCLTCQGHGATLK